MQETIIKCDKCGNTITEFTEKTGARILGEYILPFRKEVATYELCVKCVKELHKWIHN